MASAAYYSAARQAFERARRRNADARAYRAQVENEAARNRDIELALARKRSAVRGKSGTGNATAG